MPAKKKEDVLDVAPEVAPLQAITEVEEMTLNDFAEWVESEGGAVEFDGGGQWELVKDKNTLVSRPFMIAGLRFNEGDAGNYVSIRAFLIPEGTKVVFNDGGTGVYKQLQTYVAKHNRTAGIAVPKGLRVSHYTFTDKDGSERPAETFYIA